MPAAYAAGDEGGVVHAAQGLAADIARLDQAGRLFQERLVMETPSRPEQESRG